MHRTRFWPEYDEEQVEAVAAVLRSGRVNAWTGPTSRPSNASSRITSAPPTPSPWRTAR